MLKLQQKKMIGYCCCFRFSFVYIDRRCNQDESHFETLKIVITFDTKRITTTMQQGSAFDCYDWQINGDNESMVFYWAIFFKIDFMNKPFDNL